MAAADRIDATRALQPSEPGMGRESRPRGEICARQPGRESAAASRRQRPHAFCSPPALLKNQNRDRKASTREGGVSYRCKARKEQVENPQGYRFELHYNLIANDWR